MNPIPTPQELREMYLADKTTFSQLEFAHAVLTPMIEEARAALAAWQEHGPKTEACLRAKQPEPWGDGHILLVPGKDVRQVVGDECWDDALCKWMPCYAGDSILPGDIVRRPLRNPWRKIADAPPEHNEQFCIFTGGTEMKTPVGSGKLFQADVSRTHYMLDSDLPPVPQEPPKDLEREKFEAVARDKGYALRRSTNGDYDMGDTRLAWDMWQAARKEKP